MTKITCKFGKPSNGWLPLYFFVDGYELDVEVSDVPVNPVDMLLDGLGRVLNNLDAEVPWHLEPVSYYFQFKPLDSKRVHFAITRSDSATKIESKRQIEKEVEIGKMELVLPLWRAVSEYASHNFSDPDFDPINLTQLQKLKQNIKAIQYDS